MAAWLRGVWLALWLVHGLAAAATGRHISIIVDTSGSMLNSDPRRYTLQLSQILADLAGPDDSLSVIRLPLSEHGCDDGPNPSLSQSLNPADRAGFQQSLDKLLVYNVNNHFAAPIHTARAQLQEHPDKSRLLLFIADSGGLGEVCDAHLSDELSELKDQGVMIAAINLGGPGAFDRNPAFSFTQGAMNAEELVEAVAEVYQHFIGGKQPQTGQVRDTIDVDIAPLTRQAFLVVAADGAMGGVAEVAGNPTAAQVDLNHKGGGYAKGLDGRRRDYRIVRLQRPEAGRWRFQVPGLADAAGWMLLQDSALGLRLLSSPTVAQGRAAPLEVELYDQDSGKRVDNTTRWPGLEASMVVEGQTLGFRDNGEDGDRQAGDGVLTAPAAFNQLGAHRASLRLQSDTLDRSTDIEFQVSKIGWRLEPQLPPKAAVGSPLKLTVQARANGAAAAPLQAVEVRVGGDTLASLRDDGLQGDLHANDGVFSGVFTPKQTGDYVLSFIPQGGDAGLPVTASLQVLGRIQFPPPVAVQLGRIGSHAQNQGGLDLSAATVQGELSLELSSDYAARGSVLEIDLGAGWVVLDSRPRTLRLTPDGPRHWPVRVRTGDCPAGLGDKDLFTVQLKALDFDNRPQVYAAPLRLVILEDPWLRCWWQALVAAAGGLLLAIVIYGFWSPSRFSGRLGVVLSPEEDMAEGFFHAVRAQRGTGSGFFRDARVYIRPNFRLSGRRKGALACLRASGRRVYIQQAGVSAPLYRQNLDGDWEPLPLEETPVRFGVVYKHTASGVYFEIRNG